MKDIYLLNSSIITSEGTFSYRRVSLSYVKKLINDNNIKSAIGHSSTAEAMSTLLGHHIPCQRIEVNQKVGDIAIVFKLNNRLPEGRLLTIEEIYEAGFKWYKLIKKS